MRAFFYHPHLVGVRVPYARKLPKQYKGGFNKSQECARRRRQRFKIVLQGVRRFMRAPVWYDPSDLRI
jgi:hypothetical protein